MALEYYKYINPICIIRPTKRIRPPEEVATGLPLLVDATEITLAQYDRTTKDFITAHKLKDYRRKQFNMDLLPELETWFDVLLEGGKYWNEQLHPES